MKGRIAFGDGTVVSAIQGFKPSPTMKLRQAFVKAELQALGMTFRKTEWGEFRVAFRFVSDSEASAYYTEDLQDALDTGRAMFNREQRT